MANRIILYLLLIFSCENAFGQNGIQNLQDHIDSLKQELAIAHRGEQKIEILNQISARYLYSSPDSTLKYAGLALQLSVEIEQIGFQIRALGFLGEAYKNKANLPRTLELGLRAIELNGSTQPEHSYLGPTYYNLAELYTQLEEYEKAIFYCDKMVEVGVKNPEDQIAAAWGHLLKAQIYEKLGEIDSAFIALQRSYEGFQNTKDHFYSKFYDVWPGWFNLRSRLYLIQKRDSLALADLYTVLQMTSGNDEFFHSANTYNDLSLYYKKSGQLDSSIYYAEKGLDDANRISYTQGILNACKILAEQYEATDSGKALYYFKLATENQGKLYGAGNIQIMSDIIAKDEARRQQIQTAEINYRNRLKQYMLLAGLFTILVVAIILFRNYRNSKASNLVLENTLLSLKATQSQLIQSEKMASLGELTAGIAHEIQNPLNFVNNFSELNEELIADLRDELKKGNLEEVENIVEDLFQNEEKIKHHGKRAEGIVKSMLQHSRTSEGKKELTDINALCDEYVRLAYHGFRAKDKSFNATIETHFDPNLPKVEIIPQDIGRVILNLVNNAFQACTERSKGTSAERSVSTLSAEATAKESALSDIASDYAMASSDKLAKSDLDYKPTVSVSTKLSPAGRGVRGGHIQISIADNGAGIPEEIKDKIFQPFFTTRPTGQGTGLGLSLSYDIVKAHGGELTADREMGEGTVFTIHLET